MSVCMYVERMYEYLLDAGLAGVAMAWLSRRPHSGAPTDECGRRN